ncbi:phosphoenolpyruvate-protein phosphotransferase [Ectothiorhodospira haloalkaliphila]|uniref:phosphoenolpyruvate--protein phosphotransferase n=1 Tax=Ectothiorhodospira haloalkaliphila TaxID=421628 RepID=W8KGV2_9GAMM|nr:MULTISPECIES: phosphoenolpyruvate--protein phosphotransferase [Ectothiorhodospira]AHK78408.1 phosphoenolpyruvate-protein phosphotransferase [Ectothiorhodospira haloalkaliphila]MCG5495928.1 phosphoenolpyruvate--protein phosphotransferase [Ectothiorhodospira variabilis]MCG5499014.1 phosphoenolpyruvate--protein phosphotransferase [Ectothiorhodospira variabilis]MCG5505373.1 phosphoenolpyruvate--protein phosphotransferase [Ectothiorhodospira variabilis]MCG5508563.1 phosphoenolpyruvate--protein p
MLHVLRRIVLEVGAASNLAEALEIIVRRVKQELTIDVCSVYLREPEANGQRLLLMASEGLNPDSVGTVVMNTGEGLVGLVAERAEPVNLENAPDHPRFKYFPETGEERYHAFLGVPIIHNRRLLGVLVAQQRERRRFDDEHVAFLITLAAQLAGAISHAELIGEVGKRREEIQQDNLQIAGIPGAAGVAVGQGVVAYALADLESVPDRDAESVENEETAFREAVKEVQDELIEIKDRMEDVLPMEERLLFDAYVMMLGSDSLVNGTVDRIRGGSWAPAALRDTVRESTRNFEDMDDPYLRERASDVRDIGRRILMRLQSHVREPEEFPEHTILLGEDVTATQLAEVPPDRLAAVVSSRGTGSSHVAILARAMGIPAVMGVADLPVGRLEGRQIVVDGYRGNLYIQPTAELLEEFKHLQDEEKELAEGLRDLAQEPAITQDGVEVPVYANSGLLADIAPSIQSGADGIGLYRTEVPFMIRERFPGEDEQTQIYREILKSFNPRPVTLRTLDVGGDKALPYFPVTEDNPFLGWRGIRITLDHPEIFLTQLRAMLRASQGLSNLHILFPMISSLGELKGAMQLLQRARDELLDEHYVIPVPKVGVMVEVPSAVYLSEALARRVDFLSVGTNDLVQYLLAVDRNNPRVADLYNGLHPAVLHALDQTAQGAHRAGKTISVCGEMAADPASVILLLGMEIDALSVNVAALARVKWVIRSFSRERCRELLRQCVRMEEPAAIRALLDNALVQAGLGGLVRAGKA